MRSDGHGRDGTADRSRRAAAVSDVARVVIVDDHQIVRFGLRSVLEPHAGVVVVGEAGDPDEALAEVAATRPDLVLLDLRLGADESSGLDLCGELARADPDVAVVVLTTFLEDRLVVEAARRGARGYVLKDVDADELVRVIRAVHRGGSAFDGRAAQAAVRSIATGSERQPTDRLTDRERQVVRLVARGMSNQEIGAALFISESTVKFHVHNAMRKLAANRRAEVAYAAAKQGLV